MVVITTICLSSWNLRRTPIIVSLLAYMEETRTGVTLGTGILMDFLTLPKALLVLPKALMTLPKVLWALPKLSDVAKFSLALSRALMTLQQLS